MITLLDASVADVLAACDHLGGAEHLVDDVDRAAAARRRRPADARRTLAGRAALRLLVATASGLPAQAARDVPITRRCEDCDRPHGRPTTPGFSLSTSSSGERVLVAVAPAGAGIGVDLEAATPKALRGAAGLDDYALHPDERDAVVGAEHPDRARLQRWVEKEAVLKAAGTGLRVPPNEVVLAAATAGPAHADGVAGTRPHDWREVVRAPLASIRGLAVVALPGDAGHHRAIAAARPLPLRAVDVRACP